MKIGTFEVIYREGNKDSKIVSHYIAEFAEPLKAKRKHLEEMDENFAYKLEICFGKETK